MTYVDVLGSAVALTEDGSLTLWPGAAPAGEQVDLEPATVAAGLGVRYSPSTPIVTAVPSRSVQRPGTGSGVVPDGWVVEALAPVGTFMGPDGYGLVVVARNGADDALVVRVPFNPTVFGGSGDRVLSARLDELSAIETGAIGGGPGRDLGRLIVVEKGRRLVYLLSDALGDRRELLRAAAPILDHQSRPAATILVTIDGRAGPEPWLVDGDTLIPLPGDVTTVAWDGSHPIDYE